MRLPKSVVNRTESVSNEMLPVWFEGIAMKIKQAFCNLCSALFFVSGLLGGVGAVQELTVGSAFAQANPKFEFDDELWRRSDGTIHVYARFASGYVTANEVTLTVELWYEKFNPQTGRYTPERACTQTATEQHTPYKAWSYYCSGVPSNSKVQVRAIGSGYTTQGRPFSASASGEWSDRL